MINKCDQFNKEEQITKIDCIKRKTKKQNNKYIPEDNNRYKDTIMKQGGNNLSNKSKIIKTYKGNKSHNKINNKNKGNTFIKKIFWKLLFKYKTNFYLLLIIFFVINFIPLYLSKKIRKLNLLNEISLSIKGTGNQSILEKDFKTKPDEIYINGKSQDYINIFYNLEEEINNITMIWNNQLTSCYEMFKNLSNITVIDFSKFDSTKIVNADRMFYGCTSLNSLDLTNFYTSSINSMAGMFYNCSSLISLNLSIFNTSLVVNMQEMFRDCSSLISLDLTNFNTSLVQYMGIMFYRCIHLIYLDISSFKTSKATNMDQMFYGCSSLISLNLSSFNIKKINNMAYFFYDCFSLKILDISNFDTSSVTNMNGMFYNCYSLKSLDLKSFDTKNVKDTGIMFYNCHSLITLDLSNFETTSNTNIYRMFFNCSSLISLNINNIDLSLVNNIEQIFYGCKSLISLNLNFFRNLNSTSLNAYAEIFENCNESLRYCLNEEIPILNSQLNNYKNNNCSDSCFINTVNKFIIEKRQCIDRCSNDDYYRYEYKNICYNICPNDTHSSIENNYLCEDDLICENYYNYNHTGCLNNIPEGYYLNDSIQKTIDKCLIKCDNCTLQSISYGLCISCNNNEGYYRKYNDSSNVNTFINCYKEELDGYYLDIVEEIYKPCYFNCKKCKELGDVDNNKCTDCYNNYTLNGSNCVKEYENEFNYILNITDITSISNIDDNNNNINDNKDIKYYVNDYIISNNVSNTPFYFYEIRYDENDLQKKYINGTFIDFPPETKNILLNEFNLDIDKNKIYVLIIDYISIEVNSATSDFDYQLFLENGTFLNLSEIKEDFYVDIYLPIIDLILAKYNYSIYFADQGYDIYNKKSNFYHDVCSPAHIDNNDIILDDRKIDIYPNNVSLCKNNCKYKSINIEEKRIICECNLNIYSNYIYDEEDFLKEEDNGNFFNYLLDHINYRILVCYKLLLNFDNLKQNFSFYLISSIFLVIILADIIFCLFGLVNIRKIILRHFPTKQKIYNETIRELERLKINIKKNSLITGSNKKNKLFKFSKKKIKKCESHIEGGLPQKSKRRKTIDSIKDSANYKIYNHIKLDKKNYIINYIGNINELPFTQAIYKDKRSFFRTFMSIVFQKLELIDLIFGEHNIRIILLHQYILSLLIDFLFNTLLYSDDIVSQKYHNNGKLDYIVNITLSILSNVITFIICNWLNFSKGAEERLEQILQIKKEFYFLYAMNKYIKILKIRMAFYFIIEIFFGCFSFYYNVIFCIVYRNSQISLLFNYLLSLLESLINSVIISFIVVITRKIGIMLLNNNIYNTSKYINNYF